MTDRRKLTLLGIALAIVLFAALNTWSSLSLRGYRLDLTENRLFTLSQGTRSLLSGMEEPVTLRLYTSRSLREANPYLATYAARVEDALQAYAEASDGKVAVELIDPEPFSPDEDRAVGFGLQSVGLETGQPAYFGIAGTNSTDDIDVIPVLSPDRERFLEYDLTRLVFNLANPDKPVVGVISDLPLAGDPLREYRPWQVYTQLGQFFDVQLLGGDVPAISPETRLLLIVHPVEMRPETLVAVDQFVMNGGKAMVFVDPHSEAGLARQRQPGGKTTSDLEPLLTAWGVELVKDQVVGDPAAARQVQVPSNGRTQVMDYLAWLALPPESLSRTDPVTADLTSVNLASAGWLRGVEGATTQLTPLLTSSAEAMAIPADKVRLFPDPQAILRDYQRGGVPMVMAAKVTGPARSAYQGELPGGVTLKPEERLLESKAPIDVIVVADSDILDDRTWLVTDQDLGHQVGIPVADNGDFVAAGMDYLAGSSALSGLRGRDVGLRPFQRVNDLRRTAESQYRAKEQELTERLQTLQQKLASAEVGENGDASLLSEAQEQDLEQAREQLLLTRRELRDVQHALRRDIETLRSRLEIINIAAVPVLVALVAVAMALVRRARFRRRHDAAAA